MKAGILTRWMLVLGVLTVTVAVARAHQIQNGSFESGINPPAPPTPPRVSADPGTPNLTEPQTDQPFRPPFLGPLGWSGLADPHDRHARGHSRSGGSQQQAPLLKPPAHKNAGHHGGGGGGSGNGSGGGGSHGRGQSDSQPHALQTLVTDTATPLYPAAGTSDAIAVSTPDGTASAGSSEDPRDGSPPGTGDSGDWVRDPIWVASLRGSGPLSFLAETEGETFSLRKSPNGDEEPSPFGDDGGVGTIPNPAPPGLILGLMAVGTLAMRYRRVH
ncbi:MAG: hypothetical protein LC104_16225 [Bacteroidales bacterium]|nr:hypothetical protein [Bacteroidales bacterium]